MRVSGSGAPVRGPFGLPFTLSRAVRSNGPRQAEISEPLIRYLTCVSTPYGTKYVVEGEPVGLRRTARVRSVWIGEGSERTLRRVTA